MVIQRKERRDDYAWPATIGLSDRRHTVATTAAQSSATETVAH